MAALLIRGCDGGLLPEVLMAELFPAAVQSILRTDDSAVIQVCGGVVCVWCVVCGVSLQRDFSCWTFLLHRVVVSVSEPLSQQHLNMYQDGEGDVCDV